MTTRLTEDQRQAVDQHHGFLEVEGGGAAYVVMSMQVFREMMGIGSEASYQASLAAIREGLADVEAGRTQPIDDFFQDLTRKHDVPR
jgi:PHD/YefM family antitoxin component YafN of YafNO toxin-antitoxin module